MNARQARAAGFELKPVSMLAAGVCGACLLAGGCRTPATGEAAVAEPAYPAEEICEAAVGPDEALVNVSLAVDRWPDCTTLASAAADIFRIEGVAGKSDQEKALALWKWFRILTCSTGGIYGESLRDNYAFEGPAGAEQLCFDPHKILTVYGHHMCDGLSWTLAPLWRAAGYMAFDECTHGHTIAALRYRDADGALRFHSFDPNGRFFYWDDQRKIVGTWTLPVMRGRVYRHVLAPRHLHSLRTSLRIGERIHRCWDNTGSVIPYGKERDKARNLNEHPFYTCRPGRTDGAYAVVGEESQTLVAVLEPATFTAQLWAGCDVACSAPEVGKATAHPAKPGEIAELVYRLPSPYVVADARCYATLVKAGADDLCRLLLSRDGTNWAPIFTKATTGEEDVTIELGRWAREKGTPDAYAAYDFFIKAEFRTAADIRGTGMNALCVWAVRQLNKRTLPNLRPGRNCLRLTADRLAPGWALAVQVDYRVKGEERKVSCVVREFPHYFRIDVPGAVERALPNYDQAFNDGDLQMVSIKMRLIPEKSAPAAEPSLPEAEGRACFAAASPHPADFSGLDYRKVRKAAETDIRQTSGFLPQGDSRRLPDDAAMEGLIKHLGGNNVEDWMAMEDLGDYPGAIEPLLQALPKANIDQTLFICKALAKLKDPRAVKPLLEKWKKEGAGGAPGTRYIPDVLAAIGDASVVPDLVAPLGTMRFDFRFHIAHALGILGGAEAEKALEDLAARDPFPAVREKAAAALEKLKEGQR